MTNVKRASRVLRTASVLASFLVSSGHALADDAPTQTSSAAKTELHSGPHPDDAGEGSLSKGSPEQAAAVAYQKALASYSQGDLAAALDSMRRSYQLSKRAELLYNLAQLEEELKACSDSLADYRRYLELVPHGRYREEAESGRARLERECPPPAAAAAPVSAPPIAASPERAANNHDSKQSATTPEPTPYWTVPRVFGWSAIATGTLASVGALYFALEAKQARNEFQQSVDENPDGGYDTSLQDRQHRDQTIARVLAVTGGALVAGGALVLILGPRSPEPQASKALIYLEPGRLGAIYTRSF